jgi:hypothetical protein
MQLTYKTGLYALVPTFFVPEEKVFAVLAQFAGKPVPPLSECIYSITFDADGVLEEWTATVSESLRGTKRRITRPRGRKKFELVPQLERLQPLSDPASCSRSSKVIRMWSSPTIVLMRV